MDDDGYGTVNVAARFPSMDATRRLERLGLEWHGNEKKTERYLTRGLSATANFVIAYMGINYPSYAIIAIIRMNMNTIYT